MKEVHLVLKENDDIESGGIRYITSPHLLEIYYSIKKKLPFGFKKSIADNIEVSMKVPHSLELKEGYKLKKYGHEARVVSANSKLATIQITGQICNGMMVVSKSDEFPIIENFDLNISYLFDVRLEGKKITDN